MNGLEVPSHTSLERQPTSQDHFHLSTFVPQTSEEHIISFYTQISDTNRPLWKKQLHLEVDFLCFLFGTILRCNHCQVWISPNIKKITSLCPLLNTLNLDRAKCVMPPCSQLVMKNVQTCDASVIRNCDLSSQLVTCDASGCRHCDISVLCSIFSCG